VDVLDLGQPDALQEVVIGMRELPLLSPLVVGQPEQGRPLARVVGGDDPNVRVGVRVGIFRPVADEGDVLSGRTPGGLRFVPTTRCDLGERLRCQVEREEVGVAIAGQVPASVSLELEAVDHPGVLWFVFLLALFFLFFVLLLGIADGQDEACTVG
jgi:hypothetical protein